MNTFLKYSIILLSIFFVRPVLSQVKKISNSKVGVKKGVTAKNTIKSKAKPVIHNTLVKNKNTAIAKKNVKPATNTPVQTKAVKPPEVISSTLTDREKQMIDEINQLRTNPPAYLSYVDQYLKKMDADADTRDAAKELTATLKKMKPLPVLTINPDMYNDAKQYGLLMAKNNVFEHSSLPYYENLSLGHRDIRDAVLDLLIDDGIPERGHRKNLLNESLKYVAVFELPGKIKDIPYCYVQEFK